MTVLDARSATEASVSGELPTPHLVLAVDRAVARFLIIFSAFGPGTVHYAVKANPHPVLIQALEQAGSRFDVASPGELELCLSAGVTANHLVYSNPVKRGADIATARSASWRSLRPALRS